MNAQVKMLSDGKVGLVVLDGEIDFSTLPQIRQAIEKALKPNPSALLMDLSAVSFIASDGLGVLIEARSDAQSKGRKFDLIHPQPHILGLLRKTKLTRLFTIYPSVEEALKGIA